MFCYPVQLHAFLLSIGTQRQRLLRDLTSEYYNLKCGGIELIDLTFPLLKQLTGLRRLHITMKSRLHETNLRRGWLQLPFWRAAPSVNLCSASPNLIPGVKHLFDLRGLTDIKIRDTELEERAKDQKKEPNYPGFRNKKNEDITQLSRAFEHFNLACLPLRREMSTVKCSRASTGIRKTPFRY